MIKVFYIAIKDFSILLADRSAFVMLIFAPIILTLGMGFVTGAFSDDDKNVLNLSIAFINQDEGNFGDTMLSVFQSESFSSLLTINQMEESDALLQLDDGDLTAVIVIFPGFSEAISNNGKISQFVRLYPNPNQPISSQITESIVSQVVNNIRTEFLAKQIIIKELIKTDRVKRQEALNFSGTFDTQIDESSLTLIENSSKDQSQTFTSLKILAPGMALFFLIYASVLGAKNVLTEKEEGTMARLNTITIRPWQILLGKVLGIFLVGFSQTFVLTIASYFFLGLRWGDWLGVLLLTITVSLAATGWGMLLAGLLSTSTQITSVGTGLMLFFGIVSGTFIPLNNGVINVISKFVPNTWALEGFQRLLDGKSWNYLADVYLVLILMAFILLVIGIVLFNRKEWQR